MSTRPRLPRFSRPIAAIAILLAGALFLLTQKLGLGPGWGWGRGGADPNAVPLAGSVDVSPQPAGSNRPAESPPKPLQITIDESKYLVGDRPVESIDELVKLAVAVPKEAPAPRVVILLRPTARYLAEKKLTDALQKAKVDFRVQE